jgi:hypothetical protein
MWHRGHDDKERTMRRSLDLDRLRDFRTRFARRRSKSAAANTEGKLYRPGDPQDVVSPRAKSQRHGKVTADRWNQ